MMNAALAYPCNINTSTNFQSPPLFLSHFNLPRLGIAKGHPNYRTINPRKLSAWASASTNNNGGEKKTEKLSFLSLEEAGLIEISGLSTHERFLCRLTISSLNLLRVISEQEGCSIEELNAGRVCDWFLKDKLKREQNFESAVLQWDDSDFQF